MKRHKLTVAGLIIAVAAVVVYFSMTRSADEDKQAFAYPAPRYPRYLANPSAEELMRGARFAVRQPVGRAPLGRMESGRTVYVFAHAGIDMKVWEAIRQAWAERGVEAHVLHPWEVMGISREEFDRRMTDTPKGNEGWKELGFFRGEYLKYFPEEVRKEFGTDVFSDADYRRKDIPRYLDAHPEVQFYYAGEGGGAGFIQPYDKEISEKHGDKFVGNYIYYRVGDLTSKAAEYPTDVWNLVEEKILRPRTFVSEVTLQDPEGTNLHWTLTPEQSLYWTRGGNVGGGSEAASNHISIYPSPLFSNFQEGGILVAHSNHTGMYPTMKAYLDRYGQIERIEGGGKLGEMFKILLNHPLFKEAKFPKAPEPGYWFFRQDGYATNPKFVRYLPSMIEGGYYLPNVNERNRAGVQHLAFSYGGDGPEDEAYAMERGIPIGGAHTAHMHVYFPTVKWKLRDTGEWITIGEKGYVKMFDDPEVRALASRYGDPDLIFRYEWIPSIPGVNVAGDYKKDFAPDPWEWMMAEWKKVQDGSYQYFVDDYTLDSQQQVAQQ